MRHLMSTLIRIQFALCYLDFEILESCRGSGDSSQLQDVIRLGNIGNCLMPPKTMAKSLNNSYLVKSLVYPVYVYT